MKLTILSENSLLILFEQKISHDIFEQVTDCAHRVDECLGQYILDLVPSYNSIHILFNLNKISGDDLKSHIINLMSEEKTTKAHSAGKKIIEIPVYYGEEVALDLEYIANRANISTQDVIMIHSEKLYDVYAIGFAPGFAYLGNVDDRIATPRKETPRQKIPKGSLGIADQQTAIYPADSPGGWQIVGKTPVSLIDYHDEKLTKVNTGDQIKFNPISRSEYIDLGGSIECP